MMNMDLINYNHEQIMKTVCLMVNASSAKTNILFDVAIILKAKLFFLSCKEIPDYFLPREYDKEHLLVVYA